MATDGIDESVGIVVRLLRRGGGIGEGQRANGLFCVTEIYNYESGTIGRTTYSFAWAKPCGNNEYKTFDTGWVLVGAGGQTQTSATKGIRRIVGKAAAAPSNAAVTNLAPLRLSR